METVRTTVRDECARLDGILRTLTEADLDRPTPCPPWAVRDLVAHVGTGAARVIVDLLTGGRAVPAGLGWDPLTVIRKTTGRAPLSAAERAGIAAADFRWLSFAA